MTRRNPPEGIWQPRPIPGMPERLHEVLDDIGIPWHFVSEDTPVVERALAWADRMFEAGKPSRENEKVRVAEGPGWRVVASSSEHMVHLGLLMRKGDPFDGAWPEYVPATGIDWRSWRGRVAFIACERREGRANAVGVAIAPRRLPNPGSVWAELAPWPAWWRPSRPGANVGTLSGAFWDGALLRMSSIGSDVPCRSVTHETAHWLLASPDRRADSEFMAAAYNPGIEVRGLKSLREEAAVVVVEQALSSAAGCDQLRGGGSAVGGVIKFLALKFGAGSWDEFEPFHDRIDVDRVAFGVFDAGVRWLRSREREFPVWLRRRIHAEAERLAADFDCGLPTRADLKRFGLSREYERIGGRVQ